MYVTLGIQIWETPLPNPQGTNIDGVLWFPDGKELYSEHQMDVSFKIGEHLILWEIRPDAREGKGTPVVSSGKIMRGLVKNHNVLQLYVVEVKGGELRPVSQRFDTLMPATPIKQ